MQSLDHTMQATIQENKHFRLFNKLPKPKAGATVDEWTEMSSVGGFLGGSTNSESGSISNATGTYNRRVGLVKYLMTQRQVTLVQTLQGAIADSEAIEYSNGAKQLLTDAEYLSFEGDSTVVPTEFDGIYAQMMAGVASGQVDTANVLDAHGQSLASVSVLSDAASTVSEYGNFGTPTDLFFSQLVQSDFDKNLDPAYRVPLTDNFSSVQIGSPVRGIRTSWGDIATNPDVFIRDEKMKQPFELYQAAIANANIAQKPSAVAGTPVSDASSYFLSTMAGNYYYYVTGVTAAGQSTGLVSAQVAVAAGQSVNLVISASASGQETGYVIYRSRLNGGAVLAGSLAGQGSDFREMCRVAKAGATTTYVDQNRDIPGASKGFLLNLTPGDTSVNGIAFKLDRGQMISEDIPDDVAATLATIPGYTLVEAKKPKATKSAPGTSEAAEGNGEEAPETPPAADGEPATD